MMARDSLFSMRAIAPVSSEAAVIAALGSNISARTSR